MLDKDECQAIHAKNARKRVWLENLAANDRRLVLCNADETLHIWMNAEWDPEEQAQAARLCGTINELASAGMRASTQS
jgi:hypothetical protein